VGPLRNAAWTHDLDRVEQGLAAPRLAVDDEKRREGSARALSFDRTAAGKIAHRSRPAATILAMAKHETKTAISGAASVRFAVERGWLKLGEAARLAGRRRPGPASRGGETGL